MDKKAQGLSLNTIIIAIIVMIVLVVIIMVFTGYFGAKFTPGVTNCANNGGTCIFEAEEGEGCGYDAFGSKLATVSGTCAGEQICCSKGLGSGTAPVKDAVDCGQEGKAPCSTGEPCLVGEDIGGKCVNPCTTTVGCVAATTCKTTAVGGCTSGVCCSELNPVIP